MTDKNFHASIKRCTLATHSTKEACFKVSSLQSSSKMLLESYSVKPVSCTHSVIHIPYWGGMTL